MLALTVLTWQALSLSMGPVRHRAASPIRHGAISACDGSDDLNFLQTKLHRAVADEDYEAAAMLRDKIERNAGVAGVCDWGSLGVPEWLADRLHKLNFAMPTRVQLQALRATSGGDDAAICADTGSGKTLAYLVPALSQLSDDLMQEDLSLFLSAALNPGAAVNPRGQSVVERARERAAKRSDDMETEMETPALLIVVPTRELGVQTSLLAYRLCGGGQSNPTIQPYTHPSRYRPGNMANMFSVLLPSTEEARLSTKEGSNETTLSVLESSLRVMEMFRANQTSVLVTTVAATRGLDFPGVTDVFNLGIVGSAADYLHRAGRIGRIGQSELGRVVSVLQPAEVADLQALASELQFTATEREVPPMPSLEDNDLNATEGRESAVQTLEEIFSLYN